MVAVNFEIPVFGPGSVGVAVAQGATRLELNKVGSYVLGGTTPTIAELTSVMEYLANHTTHVVVRPMIRPRGPPPAPEPDFLYSEEEFDEMRQAIIQFKQSGQLREEKGDGFVFGILKLAGPERQGSRLVVDAERNAELVRLASPFKCVFHRAFDDLIGSAETNARTVAWKQALSEVLECGFHGILTSGGPGNAPDNVDTVKAIVTEARDGPEIVIGGGVRSTNVRQLAAAVATKDNGISHIWFHSSCLVSGHVSEAVNGEEVHKIVQELSAVSK